MYSHILVEKVCESEIPSEIATSDIDSDDQCATPKVTRLHMLGDFQLILEDAPVKIIDAPRLQSLLAYLAIHHGVPQSRSRLAYLFWPDSTDDQARTNLRNLIFKLRQAIPGVERLLQVDWHTLQWCNDETLTVDVTEFELAVACANLAEQEEDHITLRLALERAARLYRGELLPGYYDEWILLERDRLNQLFLGVLERLIALLAKEGKYQEAIRVAQRLLRHDPLNEAAYRNLMHLYAASGNRAAAERTYQNCLTVLERELAVGPSKATREVHEQCMQRDTASTPVSSPQLPFVLRDGNRWVKVSPEQWMEVCQRVSKLVRTPANRCSYYTSTSLPVQYP
jgi:DNA-binding SARP family transcriptional activator